MRQSKKVTIYTQVYNTEQYLERCLDSVLSQTYKNFEYIVLNNGSQDRCGEIIDRYAALDSRIKPVHLVKNGSYKFEITMKHGTGEYYTVIDSDDWWDENYLERLIGFLEEKDLDLAITGSITCFDADGSEKIFRKLDTPLVLTQQQFAQHYHALWGYPSTHWGSIMKMDLFERVGNTDLMGYQVPYGSDTLCMLEYLTQCNKIGIDNSAMYHYRIRAGSDSSEYNPNRFSGNIICYERIRDFLEQNHAIDLFKENWLKRVHINSMCETLTTLQHSQLSTQEKMEECLRIMEHSLTSYVLNCECNEKDRWYSINRMIITQSAGKIKTVEEADAVRALLRYISPDCADAFRLEDIPLYAREGQLWKLLLENDRKGMISALMELIEQGKYLGQFDFGTLLNDLLPDSCLLKGEMDVSYYRTFAESCSFIFEGDLSSALEQMTGVLLENNAIYAEEKFLKMYLSIAALENQISAFLYGNIRLAYFYFNERRIDDCCKILRDIDEMGAGDHDDVVALRSAMEK